MRWVSSHLRRGRDHCVVLLVQLVYSQTIPQFPYASRNINGYGLISRNYLTKGVTGWGPMKIVIPSSSSTLSHLVLLKLLPWRPVQFSVTVIAYIAKQSNSFYLLPITSVATMHSNTTLAAPAVVSVLTGGRRNDKCWSTASAGYNTNV